MANRFQIAKANIPWWEKSPIRRDPVCCEQCGNLIPRGDTVVLAGGGERCYKTRRRVLCLDCYD
jgi:hypothetical protein